MKYIGGAKWRVIGWACGKFNIEQEKEQVYEGTAAGLSKLMVLKGKSEHQTQNEQPKKHTE